MTQLYTDFGIIRIVMKQPVCVNVTSILRQMSPVGRGGIGGAPLDYHDENPHLKVDVYGNGLS